MKQFCHRLLKNIVVREKALHQKDAASFLVGAEIL
jgi:hypothetical protein